MIKWGFVGCGNLAQAIIAGALKEKLLSPNSVSITNRTLAKSKKFSQRTKVRIALSNLDLIKDSQVIVVGTKPDEILTVLEELKKSNLKGKIIISLAAGVEGEILKGYCKGASSIIRVMANTPATIQKGFFGIYAVKASLAHRKMIFEFFQGLGEPIFVKSDSQITAVTAGSASGVGFVFQFIQDFEKWFELKGLAPNQARNAAISTFLGAAELAKAQSGLKLSDLLARVTSKNGTTFAGLKALKQKKVGAGLKSGLDAAFKRSHEIAKSLRQNQK